MFNNLLLMLNYLYTYVYFCYQSVCFQEMEKENMKKDEALKTLQNQVSEETIKASMLIL